MYKKVGKRMLDLIFSIILLAILSPILLIVTVAIKLETKGPAIFKQTRSGKNNQNFTLYKFRSMTANNNVYDRSVEDHVTKVGKIIRKTSIDELPQLFNIIKGEMSFIGPRPWIVDYAKFFTKHQMRRLEVLPGITGLAQCSGRNNLGIKDRIDIDVTYVDNVSLKMDVIIVFKTIKCILKGEGFSSSKSAIHEELRILEEQHTKEKDRTIKKSSNNKRKNRKKKDEITNIIPNDNARELVGSGV